MRLDHSHTQCPVPLQGDLAEHLLAVPEGQYDRRIAEFLATASAWSYSDLATFTDVLCRRGLDGQCVEISLQDEALLVDTTVYMFQSHDRKLAVIAFRGTPPTNVVNWLTDTSTCPVPFMGQGAVHGGLHNNLVAVWPLVKEFLAAIYTGESLVTRLAELTPKNPGGKRPPSEIDKILKGKRKVEAIYIAGHGLGGSLASMTAAGIAMEPKLAPLLPLLRAVYAFGPARFADPTLARALHQKLGMKVFSFMFQRDVVTKMPTLMYGRFVQFGRRYVSSWRDGEWVHELRINRQLMTMVAADMIGTMAWMKDGMLGGRVVVPFAWTDHSPLNYVRISRNSSPDPEMP